MKKITSVVIALVFCLSTLLFSTTAFAMTVPYQVDIYDSGEEGLAIRAKATSDSEKLGSLVDGNVVTVTQISNGWGYINQGGCEGWIYLQWTKIHGSAAADAPTYGFITPANYIVYGTGSEGLEQRVSATAGSSTFGSVPDGAVVYVTAIQGDWAYASYNGRNGWLNTAHLRAQVIAADFQVTIYGTGSEGLALKASADINSTRYATIPEGTQLHIDGLSGTGWARTSYNGTTGWIFLRYTKIVGNYTSAKPSWGSITPTYYKVIGNTADDSMELRTEATINASSFGSIPDGTVVLVEAIVNDWAYISYNGHKGWGNISHLEQTNIQVTVVNTDGEGLALKASADGNSQRLCMIPDGTSLNITQVTNGWGSTSYNGQQGWVSVRYTKLTSKAESDAPSTGFITAKNYTVVNASDGLALRTDTDGENILLDVVPQGTQITVTAIENNWGYTTYNGSTGWVLMSYLQEVK